MAFNKAKALQEAEKSVSGGKTSQAIKQYLEIIEKDPADLALLNTVGDLYMREKPPKTAEALKQFQKLADSYIQEGFTVKAIAILKKISKLDSNAVDPLMKLAELYTVQGLGREAREQYAQAVELYKKKNQTDKAIEVFRKIVALDPENAAYRAKLAEFCEQVGKKADAAQAYVEAGEASLRRGEAPAAEAALKKASSLDPKNAQVQLLLARLAVSKQNFSEAEGILTSTPDLKGNPAGRQLLLEAYLGGRKLDAAEELVVAVFRSNPSDFTPLASFADLCVEKGNYDAALKPLAEVTDDLIQQKETGPLMDALRKIWTKQAQHVPTLELIYKICEKTADESTLPEVLEALGHAYVQEGDLEKAESACQKLCDREPDNEQYKGLLRQVHQKMGKGAVPTQAALSGVEMSLTPEMEAAPAVPSAAEGEEASMVKEALENSDLYSRYGLAEKAVAELEKVLEIHPDQVDLHRRIFEVCQRNLPERATQAAQALARIYTQRGDLASAKKYQLIVGRAGAVPPVEAPAPPPPAPAPAAQGAEFDLSAEFGGGASEPAPAAPTESVETPLDFLASPEAAAPAPAAEEMDLSADFEAMGGSAPSPAAPAEAPAFNFEETRQEIDFYIEQGFLEEAQKAVSALEENLPGNPQVAELRKRVEKAGVPASEAVPQEAAPPAQAEEWELPSSFAEAAPVEPPPAPEPPPPPPPPVAAKPAPPPAPPVAARPAPSPAPPAASGGDILESLAGELASSLEGFDAPATPPSTPSAGAPPPAQAAGGAASLSGLLDELEEGAAAQEAAEDTETHYNLGVAFREMNLLDEGIGEFQKVVKGAKKGKFPSHFLQSCSLLALCFMEKNMPAIAVKWYLRALESPGLDEEAMLSLQYDLGVAYEQAGDVRTALEKFTEVYSQNIDFRDVADKIRQLQQKVS